MTCFLLFPLLNLTRMAFSLGFQYVLIYLGSPCESWAPWRKGSSHLNPSGVSSWVDLLASSPPCCETWNFFQHWALASLSPTPLSTGVSSLPHLLRQSPVFCNVVCVFAFLPWMMAAGGWTAWSASFPVFPLPLWVSGVCMSSMKGFEHFVS